MRPPEVPGAAQALGIRQDTVRVGDALE